MIAYFCVGKVSKNGISHQMRSSRLDALIRFNHEKGSLRLKMQKNEKFTICRKEIHTLSIQNIDHFTSQQLVLQSNKRFFSENPEKKHQSPLEKRWPSPLRPSEVELEAISDKSASALKDLEEEYKVYREARLNSGKRFKEEPAGVMQDIVPSSAKAKSMISRLPGVIIKSIMATLRFTWEIISQPGKLRARWQSLKASLKDMVQHYYLGSKLLWNDIKTTKKILSRMLTGHALTRREHKQLLRTSSDIFRMVPLAIFVIIPFMEFLLPFALKIFPNMLPSTFQDSLKKEENMKKELKMRLALAGFLQDTVEEMVSRKKQAVEGSTKEANVVALKELQEFIEKAKLGSIGNDDITRFARLFKDELTLENTSRAQLVNLCRFMGLAPYGGDNFLRFQLRVHLRNIKQDDQRILWEGISSLTKQELQEACRERGMRAMGLTKEGYKRQLGQWLDLSTAKAVPISLLIMSRSFTLEAPDPASALALSIGAMERRVVTEVMIEAASNKERQTPEYRAMKLESLERQNELIELEHKKREEVLAKKQAKVEVSADKPAAASTDTGEKETSDVTASKPISKADTPSLSPAEPEAIKQVEKATSEDLLSAPQELPTNQGEDDLKEAPKKKREITADELRALESLTSPDSMSKEKAQLAQMRANLSESLQASKEETQQAESSTTIDLNLQMEATNSEKPIGLTESELANQTISKDSKLNESDEPSKAALRVVEVAAAKLEELKSMDTSSSSKEDVDKSVQRVQNKLASMLDKLEVDIETVEAKIGDKFHMLDRDRDGNVDAEELAFVIQHVLSGQSTEQEALEIVKDLDVDSDGQISVQELIDWVSKHNAAAEAGEVFDDLFSMQHSKSKKE